MTSIDKETFSYCSSLTSVTIGNGVTRISDSAFRDCSGLTSVTITDNVKSIGGYAFKNCTSLTSIIFDGTIGEWKNIEKGYRWNDNSGNFTVHCTDGDLTKEEA